MNGENRFDRFQFYNNLAFYYNISTETKVHLELVIKNWNSNLPLAQKTFFLIHTPVLLHKPIPEVQAPGSCEF
jgi:hypothetical protein